MTPQKLASQQTNTTITVDLWRVKRHTNVDPVSRSVTHIVRKVDFVADDDLQNNIHRDAAKNPSIDERCVRASTSDVI